MYKFLAIRIHNGELTLEAVNERYRDKVKEAYKELVTDYEKLYADLGFDDEAIRRYLISLVV